MPFNQYFGFWVKTQPFMEPCRFLTQIQIDRTNATMLEIDEKERRASLLFVAVGGRPSRAWGRCFSRFTSSKFTNSPGACGAIATGIDEVCRPPSVSSATSGSSDVNLGGSRSLQPAWERWFPCHHPKRLATIDARLHSLSQQAPVALLTLDVQPLPSWIQ